MEHRMSLRVAADRPATVHQRVGNALRGELRDVSFDGAFLALKDTRPESLLRKHVRVRVVENSAASDAPVEIPALVVRARADGVGLAFSSYSEAANQYLARLYSERLSRESGAFSPSRGGQL